jgi:ribonucleoside-diphosphate reductase alpha chain
MVDDRTPPQHGLAPDASSRNGLGQSTNGNPQPGSAFPDRGLYHASDAMKSMYDMGDAPSCATCGAIMTRSGSCYRCMSCGSTSGCS